MTFQQFGVILIIVKVSSVPQRRRYTSLGHLLKQARSRLLDDRGYPTGVKEIAFKLSVSPGFVYQVEQGEKKPRDGKLGIWASVYGLRYVEVCRSLNRIPMDLVASLKEEPGAVAADLYSSMTDEEKAALLPYLEFVRWKVRQNRGEPATSESSNVV